MPTPDELEKVEIVSGVVAVIGALVMVYGAALISLPLICTSGAIFLASWLLYRLVNHER